MLTVALAAALMASSAVRSASSESPRRGSHSWVERPWDLRYIVDFREADLYANGQARAAKKNASPTTRIFRWEEFFDGTPFKLSGAAAGATVDWMINRIEFDRSGRVTSPHRHPGPLRGRINRIRYVVLSAGDEPWDRVFTLGAWFTGLGDASADWAPAVCADIDMPPPAGMDPGGGYRYGKRYDHPKLSGTFGCREWAYQLYDPARPYIDVTSYTRGNGAAASVAFIRDFIGFARFGDAKPVIGQQRGTWYCFLDCPRGDDPGRIADIAVWARTNGWSAPKPPTRSPVFPDPPASAGTYPN